MSFIFSTYGNLYTCYYTSLLLFYFKFLLVEFNFIGLDWENENEKALTNETP